MASFVGLRLGDFKTMSVCHLGHSRVQPDTLQSWPGRNAIPMSFLCPTYYCTRSCIHTENGANPGKYSLDSMRSSI